MRTTRVACMYDGEYYCDVLTRLSTEFAGEKHRSLIFEKLLPQYCQYCPHLKRLESKAGNAEA